MSKPPEGLPLVEGNLHSWGLEKKRSSALGKMKRTVDIPVPVKGIRRRARGWRWQPIASGRWKRLSADNIHMLSDLPIDRMRELAAYIEDFADMVGSALGGPESGVLEMPHFNLRAFAGKPEFQKFAASVQAPNAESLYDPRTNEMAIWFNPGWVSSQWIQRILSHEFTHAYMDLVWDRTSPLWFAEGMAEFFSNFVWEDGRLWPGGLNAHALDLVKRAGPLKDIFGLGRSEMYGDRFPILYAQAWTFVHYLFARRPDVITTLLKGDAWTLPPGVDEEWREHLAEMQSEAKRPR